MHILLRNGKNMSQKPSQSSQYIQQFKEKKRQSLELIFLASTLGNTHITSVFKQHIRKGSGLIK